MSPDKISRIIEQELETTIEELFESIDLKNPLGAASIAQVQGAHAQHICLAAADLAMCICLQQFCAWKQAHRWHSHSALYHVVHCCCSLLGNADACKHSPRGCKSAPEGCHSCWSTLQVHKGKLRRSGREVAVKVQYEDALEVSSLTDYTVREASLHAAGCMLAMVLPG